MKHVPDYPPFPGRTDVPKIKNKASCRTAGPGCQPASKVAARRVSPLYLTVDQRTDIEFDGAKVPQSEPAFRRWRPSEALKSAAAREKAARATQLKGGDGPKSSQDTDVKAREDASAVPVSSAGPGSDVAAEVSAPAEPALKNVTATVAEQAPAKPLTKGPQPEVSGAPTSEAPASPAAEPATIAPQPTQAEEHAEPEAAKSAATSGTAEAHKAAPNASQANPPRSEKAQPKGAGSNAAKPDEARATPETARDTGGALPGVTIEGDTGPIRRKQGGSPPSAGGGGGSKPPKFHKRLGPSNFSESLKSGKAAVRRNLLLVLVLTCATNILILAIPVYLFQISDRVLTSRSVDTLIMLTVVIVGAVILQAIFDAVRRFVLMRTAVEVAVRLGAPILSAASAASLHGTGREYQTLGDLQQVRGFLVSGTLISFLDVPFAPLFILAIFLVHPHLGSIVIGTSLALLVIALINQKITSKPFAEANTAQSKANMHLDSMARNSQIINALAMIPEAVRIWGKDTSASLTAQVRAQDRNIVTSAVSRAVRLLTQIAMLGWGAYLAIDGQITGGMVIAASIIAGRALAPIEGAIEGWNAFSMSRSSYARITGLLTASRLQFEKLNLPKPEGRLDVERLLYVPAGTKQVVLNGISFSLNPGEALAVIGNSGAGKTTLGKMLVGSILPTSGNVRLDVMDLRNWDPRQFGENIGYLPQDVQLFPGTIKDNIGRMRSDATDEQVFRAAMLADVHEMIANLPHGYETIVAADGAPLSGGQKQRIALARAFFGDPRFVVLDEPNSNLDSNGDKALARAVDHARKSGITTVVITQKPSLLSSVDKIMLLADGNIQLFGERTAVLEKLAGRKAPQKKVEGNG
ncbi:type I secretion system permease/ATPase [Sulfitobacter aestuarii]|uniref:Type I secretion system permease/ATPase n=1 Tax=Sulfitobacter aestuarii TaxID=2161676 RepID=A0ABW5TZG4_9RHOB